MNIKHWLLKTSKSRDYDSEVAGKVEDELSNLTPPITKHSQLVISIHGIRTTGKWQKDLNLHLEEAGFRHKPLDYGWYGVWGLLWWPAINNHINWLIQECSELQESKNNGNPCSIIAHSYGSFLTAMAMHKDPNLSFDKVILCGTFLNKKFQWNHVIKDNQQASAVLHQRGGVDIPVKIGSLCIPGGGNSNGVGFDESEHIAQHLFPSFGHSDFFKDTNFLKVWIPFMQGGSYSNKSAPDRLPNRSYYVFIIIVALIALFGFFIFR